MAIRDKIRTQLVFAARTVVLIQRANFDLSNP